MMNCEPSLQKLALEPSMILGTNAIVKSPLIKVIHDLGAEDDIQPCQLKSDVTHNTNQTHLKILANKNDEMKLVIQLYIHL